MRDLRILFNDVKEYCNNEEKGIIIIKHYTSNLPSGVYVVQIETTDGKTEMKGLVIGVAMPSVSSGV